MSNTAPKEPLKLQIPQEPQVYVDGEAEHWAAVEEYKWGVPLTNLLSSRPYIMPMGDPLYRKCSPKEGVHPIPPN